MQRVEVLSSYPRQSGCQGSPWEPLSDTKPTITQRPSWGLAALAPPLQEFSHQAQAGLQYVPSSGWPPLWPL